MKRALLALALALVPLASGLPGSCADPCVIASDGTFGYTPPAAVLASGGSVVWTSNDYTHITRDGRGLLDGANPCFFVDHYPDQPSTAVRFDIVGSALLATAGGTTLPCLGAVATPAGAVMPYFCTLHPTMRGTLVVTAV